MLNEEALKGRVYEKVHGRRFDMDSGRDCRSSDMRWEEGEMYTYRRCFGDEKKEKKGKVRRKKLLASYVFKREEKTWMRPRSMGTENEHEEWGGRGERMRFPLFHDLISSVDYEKMSESEPGARPQGMFKHSGSTCPLYGYTTPPKESTMRRKETDQIHFVNRLGLQELGQGYTDLSFTYNYVSLIL